MCIRDRVVPVIRLLKQELDIPVSVDTFKAEVAEAALEAGADMVNDIWGLKADPDMAAVIAAGNVPCCLMHNRKEAVYQSYLQEVKTDLEESLETARKAGIKEDRIILDPGIGFGTVSYTHLDVYKRQDFIDHIHHQRLHVRIVLQELGNPGFRVGGVIRQAFIQLRNAGSDFRKNHGKQQSYAGHQQAEGDQNACPAGGHQKPPLIFYFSVKQPASDLFHTLDNGGKQIDVYKRQSRNSRRSIWNCLLWTWTM